MGTVVVDIDNDYVDELCYGYQLIQEDDGSYSIWVSRSVLAGRYVGRNIDSFVEAFQLLVKTVEQEEMIELA